MQKQYAKTLKQYQDNHSFIKDTLLRNFLTAKGDYHVITERFSENKIELANYKHYSLVLMEMKPVSLSIKNASSSIHNPRIALQSILSLVLSRKYNVEIADVLQNRQLLIIECADVVVLTELMKKLAYGLFEKYNYMISGLSAVDIGSLDDIPPEYRRLTQQFELLYFHPMNGIIDIASLSTRNYVGYDRIDVVCSKLIQELKSQHYDQATKLLSDFLSEWFEPLSDAHRTVDYLTKELSTYINTFAQVYAVTMDFDAKTFQNNISRCDSASEVKTLFLNLLDDIQSVFAGVGQRSNYIDKVVDIIHKNYHDPGLSVDVLADEVGLSASHMQSVFKSTTGISVSRYLRHHRLQKAAELLAHTNISVNEISEQTGFGNASYFYTVFKKHYSITPNEYRLQHKVSESTGDAK